VTDRLSGKVALITGGARGQGAEEARLFASEGARIYIADVLVEEGEALAADVSQAVEGACVTFLELDVTDRAQWEEAAARVASETGRLDILINNAGINRRHSLSQTDQADWDRLIEVNLTGPMIGMQVFLPLLRASSAASVVNIGSMAAIVGHPTTGYSAAKFGLRGLTKSAALEFAQWRIRVNAVHPGLVDTPIIDPASRAYVALKEMTPLGRAASPCELAEAVLFFASDASSFITGVDLAVDGGLSELATYAAIWRKASQPD
jgi:3alpha(or 20beta)-hydroxysteroid dehydrogenase